MNSARAGNAARGVGSSKECRQSKGSTTVVAERVAGELPPAYRSPWSIEMGPKENSCTTQLFHLIRAAAQRVRREAQSDRITYDWELREILASSLVGALQRGSPMEVAIALGSAAELQMFPDEALFDWSREVLKQNGQALCRGVYWAVRHRCTRSASAARRFGMPVDAMLPGFSVFPTAKSQMDARDEIQRRK
jgi:hypothetical protein